jgi:hypothetical protein
MYLGGSQNRWGGGGGGGGEEEGGGLREVVKSYMALEKKANR